MKKRLAIVAALTLLVQSSGAKAADNIVRPFQSLRTSAMGGTLLTTGLYEENFFGNAARVTENPKWRVDVMNVVAESSTSTFSTAGKLVDGGDDMLSKLSDTTGKNNHLRIQTSFPSVYLPKLPWKLSVAVGVLSNTQADFSVRKSFALDPQIITDVGPALTIGRKFLRQDRLAVGFTTHYTYRLASRADYSLIDFIKGESLSPSKISGEGAHLDFDLGATYLLPWAPLDLDLTAGLAINNLLGGRYSNFKLEFIDSGYLPREQPRTLGFGIAARKPKLWKFLDPVVALEFTDIGNNSGGSIFRLIHIGTEARILKVLLPRLGINQGYFCAGLGVDLWFFQLDLSTYGEEMGKNVGTLQDRRYALSLNFRI